MRRILYALSLPLVIGAGLTLRSQPVAEICPEFIVKYGGDALWALLVFLGLRLIFHRAPLWAVAAAALAFAFGIEFSQLYQAPWLDELRANRLAALVLGTTLMVRTSPPMPWA